MFTKKILLVAVCLALIMFAAASVDAQKGSRAVRNATWQTSVNDNDPGAVQLGVRDKWSSLGKYSVQFVVAQGKRIFRGRASGSGDDWAYVSFPTGFGNVTSVPEGAYRVSFYVNGVLIGRDRFDYSK